MTTSYRITRICEYNISWVWHDVTVPFIVTRLSLLIVGWFAQYFPPNPYYPIQEAIARGWQFSPFRLLDIWGRWDAGWYLSIVRAGYFVRGDIVVAQSNVAFFPLYSYTALVQLGVKS